MITTPSQPPHPSPASHLHSKFIPCKTVGLGTSHHLMHSVVLLLPSLIFLVTSSFRGILSLTNHAKYGRDTDKVYVPQSESGLHRVHDGF